MLQLRAATHLGGGAPSRSAAPERGCPGRCHRRFGASELRSALEREEFEPYLQPLVTSEGVWSGAEVLMRWEHSSLGMLSPAQFMDDLKSAGLLGAATGQILLKTARIWVESRPVLTQPFRLAFNVSPDHLGGAALLAHCEAFRRICNDPGLQLVAEMPEKGCDLQPAQCWELMALLKQGGIQVAIDDFGVGDCRLHLFATGAVAYLKIDRSFVDKVGSCVRYENLLRALVDFSRSLNVKTLAEGVETRLQRDTLARLGIDIYQGYLFAKPMPCVTFMVALADSRNVLQADAYLADACLREHPHICRLTKASAEQCPLRLESCTR